jgi:hypothetical protein
MHAIIHPSVCCVFHEPEFQLNETRNSWFFFHWQKDDCVCCIPLHGVQPAKKGENLLSDSISVTRDSCFLSPLASAVHAHPVQESAAGSMWPAAAVGSLLSRIVCYAHDHPLQIFVFDVSSFILISSPSEGCEDVVTRLA